MPPRNRHTSTITGLVIAALAPTCVAQPEAPPAELLYAGKTTLPADGVSAPMHFRGAMPAVDVRVNDQGPFRFAIDTGGQGAARADRRLTAELNLPVVGTVMAGDGAGRRGRPMDIVRIDSIAFGGARFESLRAGCRTYGSAIGRIDGILGFNLFRDGLLTLDYPGRQVRFEPGALPRANGRDVLSLEDNRAIPTIPITVAGHEISATIDSGAMGGTLMVPPGVAAKLSWVNQPQLVGRARTVSGDFEIQEGLLDGEVRIGQHRLINPPIQFSDGSPRAYANIGSEILRHFATTYDQKHKRVRFARPEKGPIRLEPAYRVGVMLIPGQAEGGLLVDSVAAGGAADTAGLKAGDVITHVNGQAANKLAPAELRRLLGSPQAVSLTIRRDDADLVIDVTPQRISTGAHGADDSRAAPLSPRRRVRRSTPRSMTTPDQLADLLRRMEGAFGVTARIRRSPDEAFRTVTGNSTWTRERLGRYTHERFELTIDEQPLRGEVFFGPAASPGQFELVQVDAFNPGMIHVVGAWNEAEGRLVLERVISPKALRGVARPLRWSYRLGEGRSFVKEMHFRDGAGEWFLASDYHYRPASATRAPASTTPKKGAPEE